MVSLILPVILSVIVTFVLILNLIFHIREDKDERWKVIMSRPLNSAFFLLILGYSVMSMLDVYFNFSASTYKNGIDFIFTGVLVVYIIVLIIEKRKLS